jgi:aromatic ring-cleaving dioxygenase
MNAMSADEPTPTQMEIANIEHEIAVLRERLANIEKWANRVVWPSLAAMYLVSFVVAVYGLVTLQWLALGVGLACIAILYYFVTDQIRSTRLIEFVTPLKRGWGMVGYPEDNYALVLEKWIAEREKRLAELRAKS